MELFKEAIAGKVLLNIQTRSVETSVAATDLLGSSVLVGVMAKEFPNLSDGIDYIHQLHRHGVRVSAGLGDGSADHWKQALQLALHSSPVHLNQIFPAAALSQYALAEQGAKTLVNAMIKPTGQPGMVHVGTGPLSQQENAVISIDSAILMMKEMGIQSVKFFPIGGCTRLDEVRVVARAVAKEGLILEPTGGITPENVTEIIKTCLEAGVQYMMPHLYGSLKDSQTGDLDIEKLKVTMENVMTLFHGDFQ